MPCSSDSDLQQSNEGGTPSKNAKNALMDVKEEEAILAAAKALNGVVVLIPKKRERSSKGEKAMPLAFLPPFLCAKIQNQDLFYVVYNLEVPK
jgi:hypothetical protein